MTSATPPTLIGFEVLSVDAGGSHGQVGIRFVDPAGTPMNALAKSAPGTLGDIARSALAAGWDFHKAGAPLEGGGNTMPQPIECNRLGIASTTLTDTVLLLQFGSMLLAVTATTQDVRTALSLLDSGASGNLMPESTDRH